MVAASMEGCERGRLNASMVELVVGASECARGQQGASIMGLGMAATGLESLPKRLATFSSSFPIDCWLESLQGRLQMPIT